jgi:hypothetical protein
MPQFYTSVSDATTIRNDPRKRGDSRRSQAAKTLPRCSPVLRPHSYTLIAMIDSRVIKGNGGTRVSGSHDLSWRVVLAPAVGLLAGCNGAPSRNILGSYFPSWMVCALVGLGVALLARVLFRVTGLLDELPVPFVVMLSIACATTFALWLIWLA